MQQHGCDMLVAGTALASEFSQHINQTGMRRPLEQRGPTPMLPPTAVVAGQMDALQMNDWPDPDSGVRTAFLFSKPFECETMIAGRVSAIVSRHSALYHLVNIMHHCQTAHQA